MWTIDVAKTYHLPLGELTLAQVAKLPHKAKMLDFFAKPQWESDIKAVGASSSGKVGVLFLYKADENDKTKTKPAASPSYVVKLTDAPQRILFAEYVLKNLAKAKIPKSLVVRLDWDQYASQAMDSGSKLIKVLLNTPCHSKTKNDSEGLKTYNKNLGTLKPTSAERPRYAVIMKAFPVAASSSDPFSQAVPYPFPPTPDPKKKIAYPIAAYLDVGEWCELNNLDDKFTLGSISDKQRSQYFKDAVFQELVWNICTTKWILSNPECMRKAGRILAACAFLRNGDQLQGDRANISNIFFFLQTYKDEKHIGKENNPVGVIDNDTLATICSLGDLPSFYAQDKPVPRRIDESKKNYLQFVLHGGNEVLEPVSEDLEPYGVGGTPGAQLRGLIEKFDAWYMQCLVNGLHGSGRAKYALVPELYADDGSLWGAKGSYPSFPDDPTKGGWPKVRDNLKKGFAEVLQELNKKFFKDSLEIFSYLYDKYEFDYNFDWTTLQVTYQYLTTGATAKKDRLGAVTHFEATEFADYTHPSAMSWYDQILGKVHALEKRILEALKFGVDEGLINKRKRIEIIRFFSYLPDDRQKEFLVVEKINPNDSKKSKEKQKKRIKVVRLALLVLYTNKIQRQLYHERMLQKGRVEDAVTMALAQVRIIVKYLKERIEKDHLLFYKPKKSSDHKDLSCKSIADLAKDTGIKMAPYFPDAWKSAFQ